MHTRIQEGEKLQAKEIVASDTDSIYEYIANLSYAGQGCLSLYWDICEKNIERALVNARHLTHIRIGSGAFRSRHRLLPNDKDYEANQWKWVRKILIKLRRMGFVSVRPIGSSPSLGLQPRKKFEKADYILNPHVSKLVFKFPKEGGEVTIGDVASAHRFIMRFVPRHIPPRGITKKALEKSTLNKIKRAKGLVVIRFPTERAG